uniref:Uncharacterized protein n=1 Tax=Rhizophagus irregularis (strain DAOM 181602 / DAOM 197198 / MUCL 43194) TaxID=747089 RepID=U9TB77_RHIID
MVIGSTNAWIFLQNFKINVLTDVYDPKVDVTAIHEVVNLNGDESLRIINPRVDVVATREVVDPNGDKLLRILSNVSPKLYEYFHLDTNGISQQKS